jgi:hypothetical protein
MEKGRRRGLKGWDKSEPVQTKCACGGAMGWVRACGNENGDGGLQDIKLNYAYTRKRDVER